MHVRQINRRVTTRAQLHLPKSLRKRAVVFASATCATVLMSSATSNAADSGLVPTGPGAYYWSNSGIWSANGVPNSNTAIAELENTLSGAQQIYVSNQTINEMLIGDLGGHYTQALYGQYNSSNGTTGSLSMGASGGTALLYADGGGATANSATPTGTPIIYNNLNMNSCNLFVGSWFEYVGSTTTASSPTNNVQDYINISGNISGGVNFELGHVNLELVGTASYTGSTILNGGYSTLSLGANYVLPSYTQLVLSDSTDTLNEVNSSQVIASITGTGTINLSNGTLALNTNNTTFSGSLIGNLSSALNVQSGTLVLASVSSSPNYAGQFDLSGSGTTLGIYNAGSLGSGSVSLQGSTLEARASFSTAANISFTTGVVNVDTGDTFTESGTLSGATLQKAGSGTLILSGTSNSNYAFSTDFQAGVLSITSATNLGIGTGYFQGGTLATGTSSTVTLSNTFNTAGGSANFAPGSGSTLTASGAILGTDGLNMSGAGTLVLSNTGNDYLGNTNISNGTLSVNSDTELGAFSLHNSTVNLSSTGNFLAASSIQTQRNFNVSGTTSYISTAASSTTLSIYGNVTGSGAVNISGPGTVVFDGTNSYTGGTVVNDGTLETYNDAQLGNGGALTISSAFIYNGVGYSIVPGTFLAAGSFSTSRTITVSSSVSQLGAVSGATLTVNGTLNGSGGVNVAGGGTLLLNSAGTWTGATAINSGATLQAGNSYVLPTTTALTVYSGGTFDLHAYNQEVGSLSGAGSITLGSTGTLLVGSNNTNSTFSGTISGAGGLSKIGTGTLYLTGTNGYTGNTYIQSGILNASSLAALGGSGAPMSLLGTLQFGGAFDPSLTHAISTSGSNGTLDSNGYNITLAGSIGNGTPLTVIDSVGTGSITLAGSNTFNGLTINSGATVNVSSANNLGGTTGTIYLNGGTLFQTQSFTILNPIGDPNGTFKVAAGQTSTLTGNVTLTGVMNVAGPGTISLSPADVTTASTGGYNVTGGILLAGAPASLGTNAVSVTLNGGTLQLGSQFDPTYGPNTSGSGTGARSFVLGASGGTIDTNGYTITAAGIITGPGSLTKVGAGTLVISAVEQYTGPTNITAGTVQLNQSYALGNSSVINVSSGATLNLNGATETIDGLSGNGNVALGSGTITDEPTGSSYSYYGTLSGTGAFNVYGSGTQYLLGTNTYSGGTSVGIGILGANSNIALGQTGNPLAIGSGFFPGTFQFEAAFDPSVVHPITLGGNGAVIDVNGYAITLAGNISGSASLTIADTTGGGSLTLTGTSNQSSTTINPGATFNISNAGNLGQSGNYLYLTNGTLRVTSNVFLSQTIYTNSTYNSSGVGASTIDVAPGTTTNLTGTLNGSGGLIVTDTGTLSLYGLSSDSMTGGITVSGGATLTVPSNATLGAFSNSVTLNGGTLLTLSSTVDPTSARSIFLGANGGTIDTDAFHVTLAGSISGSGGLNIKTAYGNLTMSDTNSYTGGTTVVTGTLIAGIANIAPGGILTLNPSTTFNLNNFNQSFTALVGTGGSVTLGSATLTVGSSGLSGSYAGSISGTGGFTLTNGGSETLSGTNSYTGATNISNGTLYAASTTALGTSGPINFGALGTAGTLKFGATFDPTTNPSTNTARAVSINYAAIIDTNGNAITFANSLSGSGSLTVHDSIGALTPSLGGSLTLLAASNQTATYVNTGGVLFVNSGSDLGATSAYVYLSGGTLGTTTSTTIGQSIGIYSPGGTFDIPAGVSTKISGYINGTGPLFKTDSGTLTLTSVEGYQQGSPGGTQISGGTLIPSTAAVVSSLGTITMAGGTLVLQSGTLATTELPFAMTGFNNDVVVEQGATNASSAITRSFDQAGKTGGFAFFESGYPGSTGGLPQVHAFSSSATLPTGVTSVAFNLQPYNASNVLLLAGLGGTGSLTMSTPGEYSRLAILATAANGNGSTGVVVNFADGSTYTATVLVTDWYTNITAALAANNRISLPGGGIDTSNPGYPRIYEYDLTLPTADDYKRLSSISFTDNASSSGECVGIFGVSGASTLGQTYTNDVNVTANSTLNVSGSNLLTLGNLSFSAGKLSIASTYARGLLTVTSLNFPGSSGNWAGTLDLAGYDAVIHNGYLAAATSQLLQGYNKGTWNGSGGIVSSLAAADTSHLSTLGIILNGSTYGSGTALGSFDGVNPAPTDLLIKYTYYGDANLDGQVDGSDYTMIDNGFTNHLTGWNNGDFNYDGVIDGSDYTLIDNVFNTQGANLSSTAASLIAADTAQVASSSAVPEPASLALLGAAAITVLSRRRRAN